MVADFIGGGAQFDRVIAAETPEKDCQPPLNLREVHTGSVVDGNPVETTGKGVPQFAHCFLGLPWLKFNLVHGGPHPKTARTRSRSPAFTSASSVRGSTMAISTARLTAMPPAIRLAA